MVDTTRSGTAQYLSIAEVRRTDANTNYLRAAIRDDVPDFGAGTVGGGEGDYEWLLNWYHLGQNQGELYLQRGTYFEHPVSGTINPGEADFSVFTPFESLEDYQGEFFIMHSAVVAQTRFGGFAHNWGGPVGGAYTNILCVINVNGQWKAVDNDGTEYNFTPLSTDWLMARGFRVEQDLGISELELLIGPVQIPFTSLIAGSNIVGVQIPGPVRIQLPLEATEEQVITVSDERGTADVDPITVEIY